MLDVELVVLVLVEIKSWLVDDVGTNTMDEDCVIKVELVGCEMTVVETGVMIELVVGIVAMMEVVVEAGGIVVNTVDVG